MRERNSNLCGRKFLFRLLGHIFLRNRCYNKDFMLLFNRCIVVSLFWWFYPHLRQGNTPGGHWFVRRSFFPVWGRCNFLILLLSADLTAILPQPSQVVAAHLTPPMASESFYLSCLYFRICSSPTVISKGDWQPSELLASPQLVHAGERQVMVVLYYYYFVIFYLKSFRSGITTLYFIFFSL